MTSLSSQLKRLAVAHTQEILGVAVNTKKSLLFKPNEAAFMSRDTFYAIGVNGLQELININKTFEEFETSIFSISSQSFERSIQTKEANNKLDIVLERFMILVSPYLLLKPAQKCIEWLIHRYHIHWYNEDLILMCAIFYHESNIFVRMIQLLKIDLPTSKLYWLLTFQKSGQHLPRSILINHLHKNPGFMHFICNLVQRYIQIHAPISTDCIQLRPCFAFYTSIITGFLQREQITEDYVAILKPFLALGLESPLKDYRCATYMIIAQLCRRVQIVSTLVELLLSLMLKTSVSLENECLSCVLVIYQSQEINSIPDKAMMYLLQIPNLTSLISPLLHTYKCRTFVDALLTKLIPLSMRQCAQKIIKNQTPIKSKYITFLNDVLTMDVLDKDDHDKVVKLILEEALRYDISEAIVSHFYTSIRPVMSTLENRYPDSLSVAMEDLKKKYSDVSERKRIAKFTKMTMSGSKLAVIDGDVSTLVVSLNHHQVYVRVQAVEYMFSNLEIFLENERELLEESVIQRLDDDDELVVMAVLNNTQRLWECFTEETKLITCLKKVLMKADDNLWYTVKQATLKVLCLINATSPSTQTTIFYLLAYMVDNRDYAVTILSSALFSRLPLVQGCSKKWLNIVEESETSEMFKSFNTTVMCDIAEGISALDIETVISTVKAMAAMNQEHNWQYTPIHNALMCGIINDIIQTNVAKEPAFLIDIVPIQMQLIDCLLHNGTDAALQKDALRYSEMVVLHLSVPLSLYEHDWWYSCDNIAISRATTSLVAVFLWLSRNAMVNDKICDHFKKFTNLFFQKHFPTPRSLLSFLTAMTTGHLPYASYYISPTVQTMALLTMTSVVKKLDTNVIAGLLTSATPVVTSVLASLKSDIPDLREITQQIVAILREKVTTCAFSGLFDKLLDSAEEIHSDNDYIKEVMSACLTNNGTQSDTQEPTAMTYLLDTITHTDTPAYVSLCLLDSMELVNTQETQKVKRLVPYLIRLLNMNKSGLKRVDIEIIDKLLARFNKNINSLTESSLALKAFMEACAFSAKSSTNQHIAAHVALTALKLINFDFYAGLPTEASRHVLLKQIIHVIVNSDQLSVTSRAKNVFKLISINGQHLVPELISVLDTKVVATVRDAKRLKRSSRSTSAIDKTQLDSFQWECIIQILELLQNKKKLTNAQCLIAPCFDLLANVLSTEKDGQGEYHKQLLLSCLTNIISKLSQTQSEIDILRSENMHMEKIVQCVHTNENNPQTVHQALLLLSVVAKIDPTALLNQVITVFTFMGASVLRQDDAYSLHVISKVLETIVPQVIQACEEQSSSKTSGPRAHYTVVMVAQVFVASYQHIPSHRRLALFTKLVTVLGKKNYLWMILLLMVEHDVCKQSVTTEHEESVSLTADQNTTDKAGLDVNFCLELCSQFTLSKQISTASNILTYLTNLPKSKDEFEKSQPPKQQSVEVFNIHIRTDKQLRHFRFSSISLLISLLSNEALIAKMANNKLNLSKVWNPLLKASLQYIGHIASIADDQNNKANVKYWRIVYHKLHDLLDKEISLLPKGPFYDIILDLIGHKATSVQRKSMELLNTNIQNMPKDVLLPHSQVEQLLEISDSLYNFVRQSMTSPVTNDDDISTVQTALFGLKLLCRLLGQQNPDRFIKIVQLGSEVFIQPGVSPPISACALLCLAESCTSLKLHVIPCLSVFMPPLIELCYSDELIRNELLLMSVVTTLHKLLDNLAHFISPYLPDIIDYLCQLSVDLHHLDHEPRPQLTARIQAIKHAISTRVSSRVSLPIIEGCRKKLTPEKYRMMKPLMQLLSDVISHMTSDDLTSYHQRILSFFLVCLDFRVNHKNIDASHLNDIENEVIECATGLVLRLSEAIFKPMLFKLFHWATENNAPSDRVLVFYRLADRLAEKLKSLFTMFAAHIIKYTATVLNEYNMDKKEITYPNADQLLGYTIDCLAKCFMYYSDSSLDKERFDHLMHPLIDQIDNRLGGHDVYNQRVNDHLMPCIIELAATVQDDSMWKALNYQILLKSRSQHASVRYASLHVFEGVQKRLAEASVALLTDSVPFIAELMEDESEEVEEKCQSVMATMEEIHGESLQKYF